MTVQNELPRTVHHLLIVCTLLGLVALCGCAPEPDPAQPASALTPAALPPATIAAAATATAAASAGAATPVVSPAATPAGAISPTRTTPVPSVTLAPPARAFERIFIIVFENHGAAAALANPYFKKLAGRGAYLSNYYAVSHPSEPNYLAMVAGDPLVADDGVYNLPQKNLVDLLETAGIGWKAYQENYPGACFAGSIASDTTGVYARKHNPFISFDSIRNNPARCGLVVNAGELAGDIASGRLPAYSFFTPNMDHDGHDQPLSYAAKWFEGFIEPKLSDPNFMRGTLLVVTFDESESQSSAAANHVYTALLGPMIKAGSTDTARYSHYSLLRSVEDNFHLGTLNRKDAQAQPFAACNFTGGCSR